MPTRVNQQRDVEIRTDHEWGEPIKSLANKHKISPSRVAAIVYAERFKGKLRYPRCTRCKHSGAMHHNTNWEYNRGPCAEYRCDCPAMLAVHD